MGAHLIREAPTLYELYHPLEVFDWNSKPQGLRTFLDLSWKIDKFSSRLFRHGWLIGIIHDGHVPHQIVRDHRKDVPSSIGHKFTAGKIIQRITVFGFLIHIL
jgi:hypothetical protein